MKKMIALRRHAYGVGMKEKGEQYEATEHEARTLVALVWAAYDTAKPADQTAPAKAADEVPAEKADDKKPAKGAGKAGYERRDMKAKD